MSNQTIGGVTAKVTSDNTEFDEAWKKSADVITATARTSTKAAKASADAQAFAAKFAGDAVDAGSIRIVKALKLEGQARADMRKAQALARTDYAGEAQAIQLVAAAQQRLRVATEATARAQTMRKPHTANEYIRERIHTGMGTSLGIGEGMGGAAAGIAVTAVAAGLAANKMREAVTSSLEFGEAMERASQSTGLATTTLSTLHYAAAITGGDFASISTAVGRMGEHIGKATEGSKTDIAFMKELGLNAKQLADSTDGSDKAFRRLVQTIAATKDPIRQQELAMGLLGKEGMDQIPMLIDLGKNWETYARGAARSGEMLDAKSAESLANVNEHFKKIKEGIQGAALSFTIGLTPGLNAFVSAVSGAGPSASTFADLGKSIASEFNYAAAAVYSFAASADAIKAHTVDSNVSWKTLQNAALMGPKAKWDTSNGSEDRQLAAAKRERAMAERFLAAAKNPGAVRGDAGTKPLAPPAKGPGDPNAAAKALEAQRKAAQAKLKAFEASLAFEKTQTNVSAKAEYDYWAQRIGAFKKGSDQYNAIQEKRAQLAQAGARTAHESILKYQKAANENANMSPDAANKGIAKVNELIRQQWEDVGRTGERWREYNVQLTRARELEAKFARDQKAAQIKRAVAAGAMTKEQAAVLTSSMHAEESAAMVAALQAQLKELKETAANLDPNGAEYERQMPQNAAQQAAVGNQIREAQAAASLRASEDKWTEFQETGLGGAITALQEFTAASRDSAAMAREFVSATLDSVNKALVFDMTTSHSSHPKYAEQWKGVGRSVATDATGALLKKGEGSLMRAFGLGSKTAPKGTASDPLHVVMAGGLGRGLNLNPSASSGTPSSSAGGLVAGLLKFIPGFAAGGDYPGNSLMIVGEKGPEIMAPRSSGRIIPNDALGGGGSQGHTINIDARGSTSPAETMAMVQHGIMLAVPHIIKAANKSSHDANSRIAPTARR